MDADGADIFASTSGMMPVSVRPGQAFLRLRELGRLTPVMLAKFNPIYEVDVEEEVEKFVDVEVDASQPAPTKKAKRASPKEGSEEEMAISFADVPFVCTIIIIIIISLTIGL